MVALLVFGLVACGEASSPSGGADPKPTDEAPLGVWEHIAWFPGKTKSVRATLPTAAGLVEQIQEVFEDRDGAFTVGWADYSEKYVRSVSADVVLQGAVDGSTRAIRGRKLRDSRTRFEGHPAREVLIKAPRGVFYRARIVLAGRRLFQFSVTSTEERVASRRADDFFARVHVRERR